MMKNTFYFILILLSFLRYLNISDDLLCHVGKRSDKEAKVNFKNYDVIYWKTNNYNTHINQHLTK